MEERWGMEKREARGEITQPVSGGCGGLLPAGAAGQDRSGDRQQDAALLLELIPPPAPRPQRP